LASLFKGLESGLKFIKKDVVCVIQIVKY
jgi:hypothetical protein